jgi:lysophospholipase L1-like esterase
MKTTASISRRTLLLRLLFSLVILSALPLLADSSTQTIRVACVGDSITYGSWLTNREADSYPVRLGQLLGSAYDVRNFGVSGATMLHKGNKPYIKQPEHDEALAFKPDILVIMLGTNDSKHPTESETNKVPNNWQYKADYVPDYEALIAEFRHANPSVKIYLCDPPPAFSDRWGINGQTIHEEVIPLINQVAVDSSVDIINLHTTFAGRKDLFVDGIHPNANGAKLMATAVYIALTGKIPQTGIL